MHFVDAYIITRCFTFLRAVYIEIVLAFYTFPILPQVSLENTRHGHVLNYVPRQLIHETFKGNNKKNVS